MKILTDENIPLITIEALRVLGHDVTSLHEVRRKGMKDTAVWRLAMREHRILVTTDKGFAKYRTENHSGLLIVRLKKPSIDRIHSHVLAAIAEIPPSDWPGLLVTMRDTARGLWKAKKS